MNKFTITTPIYYVNDEPHIGHAYTTILADVLARYHRELGEEVFFLTGTDEHGQKVFTAARERGIDPKDHCDSMVIRFKELWNRLHIQYNHFIRTTDDTHKKTVQSLLQKIYDKGDIYFDEYSGFYCVGCERFYTEKELTDGKCPQHLEEVKIISEKNYFFRMSQYQERLVSYIHDHPQFIQPDFRRNEVLGFLRRPLEDLCISRPKSRLAWGIELPFDSDYVIYVWFDALLNYVTAIGITFDDARFNKWWPANCHLIGKDILTTHSVYWPTMLFSLELPLPRTIFAHGWWLSKGFKMSKSLGNVVNPLQLIDVYGVDPVRYYLMRDMVLGQDASFSPEAFALRYNSDLANDLGNLVGRISTLIFKHFHGEVPSLDKLLNIDQELQKSGEHLLSLVDDRMNKMRIHETIEEILRYVRSINRYLERTQPWKVVETDKERAGTILYCAAEAVRLSVVLLHPVIPVCASGILAMLGSDSEGFVKRWGYLKSGKKLGKFSEPFPRIELNKTGSQSQSARIKSVKKGEKSMSDQLISIEDFGKIQLKTAKVLQAEKVPGTTKLLKLQIQLGEEKRQIVAGIAEHYSPEELIGKIVIVVENLKPAVIRGVESNGMMLVANSDGKLVILTVDDPSVGSGVKIS